MNNEAGIAVNVEPIEWYMVFQRARKHRWFYGRFRHVAAVGEVNGTWLLYDVTMARTRICACRGGQADQLLAALESDAEIIAMPVRKGPKTWRRPGFWCVPAMAHLVGIPTRALRPDTFFRDCLANGGQRIGDATESAGSRRGTGGSQDTTSEIDTGPAPTGDLRPVSQV